MNVVGLDQFGLAHHRLKEERDQRRAALFERLRTVPGQYWLTGTETAPFAEILGEAAVWEVREGAVSRV